MIESYQHCIFVCSNYTKRTRTGLHFLYNDSNVEQVMDVVKKYKTKEGVAFYFLTTDKPTIESVQEKDKFFKNMNILEGTESENVLIFNNSINNQITVMDVVLLLLCKKKMTVEEIKIYLFYIYCLYATNNNAFPFKEGYFFDVSIRGIKAINNEFSNLNPDDCLECVKPDVIMSKFFNCDGGVELMNEILKIFYELEKRDIKVLSDNIEKYFLKCKRHFKLGVTERKHPFLLSKHCILYLKVKI